MKIRTTNHYPDADCVTVESINDDGTCDFSVTVSRAEDGRVTVEVDDVEGGGAYSTIETLGQEGGQR
jgi:hypothetical protein